MFPGYSMISIQETFINCRCSSLLPLQHHVPPLPLTPAHPLPRTRSYNDCTSRGVQTARQPLKRVVQFFSPLSGTTTAFSSNCGSSSNQFHAPQFPVAMWLQVRSQLKIAHLLLCCFGRLPVFYQIYGELVST